MIRIFHRQNFSASGLLAAGWGLLLSAVLAFWPVDHALAQAPQAGGAAAAKGAPRMLIVGDSISAEYGLARGQGWVQHLSDRLQQQGHRVEVINASISGETTAGGRSRLPALLKAHTPAYVVIELGGNDALRGLPLASTRDNLHAMVDAAQAIDAAVVLLGIQVPPNYGAQYSRDFAQSFETVAREQQIALVPFMLEAVSEPADLERYFQADRIHPNAAAQPVILDTVWPTIETLLQ